MPTFEVAQVMGSGSVQELICQVITLPSPAEEIKQIRKTVIIDNCFVTFDKVIVDGRLRKDILFKTAATGFPQPGTATACTGIVATIVGTLADVDVDIAFNALIPVPGARPGDTCVVLQAFVEGEKEEAANIAANGTFTSLIDKSIVFVCVKVVRDVITTGLGGTAGTTTTGTTAGAGATTTGAAGTAQQPAVCPPRASTGFSPESIFTGVIPPARAGRIQGTWVGPTLTFEGVLNPGIPTLFPPTAAPVNTLGTQVQIAPAAAQTLTTGTGTGTGSTTTGSFGTVQG